MSRLPVVLSVAVVFAAGAVALLLNGCDTAPASQALTIQPDSVTLSPGQDQAFTVSGGYTYTWSMSGGAGGVLSSSSGDRVIYSAPATATTGATQVIKVTSRIPGTSSGSASTVTNGTSNGTSSYSVSGEAFITFK